MQSGGGILGILCGPHSVWSPYLDIYGVRHLFYGELISLVLLLHVLNLLPCYRPVPLATHFLSAEVTRLFVAEVKHLTACHFTGGRPHATAFSRHARGYEGRAWNIYGVWGPPCKHNQLTHIWHATISFAV